MSSTIIGTGNEPGVLKCFMHNYETVDINEWNNHCENEGHTDSGQTQCIDCKCTIEFDNIPYQKITPAGKLIQLRCPECFQNYSTQRLKIRRLDNAEIPEEGDGGKGTIQPNIEQPKSKQAPNPEQQLKENPKPSLKGARII